LKGVVRNWESKGIGFAGTTAVLERVSQSGVEWELELVLVEHLVGLKSTGFWEDDNGMQRLFGGMT
jgi:hypothetical protein